MIVVILAASMASDRDVVSMVKATIVAPLLSRVPSSCEGGVRKSSGGNSQAWTQ